MRTRRLVTDVVGVVVSLAAVAAGTKLGGLPGWTLAGLGAWVAVYVVGTRANGTT